MKYHASGHTIGIHLTKPFMNIVVARRDNPLVLHISSGDPTVIGGRASPSGKRVNERVKVIQILLLAILSQLLQLRAYMCVTRSDNHMLGLY
jgi:hypothetical protein